MTQATRERRVRRFKRQAAFATLVARRPEPVPRAPTFPALMRMTTREFEGRTDREGRCSTCKQRNVLGNITLVVEPPLALCDGCLREHLLEHGAPAP